MAEGRIDLPPAPPRRYPWTELFRSFQVALDPRKLLVAAAGILAMSFGWFVLSAVFNRNAPDQAAAEYKTEAMKKEKGDKDGSGKDYTEDDYHRFGREKYDRDFRQWALLNSLAGSGGPDPKVKDELTKEFNAKDVAARDVLAKSKVVAADATKTPEEKAAAAADAAFKSDDARAADRRLAALRGGPPGKLRVMPWNEPRGDNPFIFASHLADAPASAWVKGVIGYVLEQVPVLTEPLNKLFLIIAKIADPNASFLTRVYLLLCLVWSIAVWAFFGGVITRIAAVQFGGKERISLKQAVTFVKDRYVSYLASPLVPLAVIAVIVAAMSLYGLVALIPLLGDVLLYGLGLPLVILGGIVITILLIGLVGYPMMNATISTEGSDTFDALSRSYNYVFQAPWQYLWYALVAAVYGVFVTFVVLLVGCLMVYFGKWAVSQPAQVFGVEGRKPEFLFVYSPKSLGWRELMLKGSPAEIALSQKTGDYEPVDADKELAYHKDMRWYNEAGAGMVTFWMVLVFLLMIGFIYSYFWTSGTMIYLLMRRKVDEVDVDEVFSQQDAEAALPAGPTNMTAPPTPPAPPAGGPVSLPTVTAPPVPPTPPVSSPFPESTAGPSSPPASVAPPAVLPPAPAVDEPPFFPTAGSPAPPADPPKTPPGEPKM